MPLQAVFVGYTALTSVCNTALCVCVAGLGALKLPMSRFSKHKKIFYLY